MDFLTQADDYNPGGNPSQDEYSIYFWQTSIQSKLSRQGISLGGGISKFASCEKASHAGKGFSLWQASLKSKLSKHHGSSWVLL